MNEPEIPRGTGDQNESRGDGSQLGRAEGRGTLHPRVAAVRMAARYHGVDLDTQELPATDKPTEDALLAWVRDAGMWVRRSHLRWRNLPRASEAGPIVIFFKDGGAGLLTGADPTRNIVFIQNPNTVAGGRQTPAVPVDALRLSELWAGDVLLLRAEREQTEADPPFTVSWLTHMVFGERKSLRDIGVASLTLSFLTIFPPLVVMTVVDRVLTHNTISTLILLATILAVAVVYETLLGHARRLIILTVGTKMDTRLNLLVFNRLLRLPLDYFERHPAGETMHKIGHIYKIREFLTGKLLSTFLDLITLLVLLPVLFYLSVALASMVLVCAALISGIIFTSLKPLRVVFAKVAAAETDRSAVLGETIFGIRTIKSLVLERQRRALWDERVARVGKARMAFGRLAGWPQTLITPIERFMSIGVILIGAYMALSDTTGYAAGALFAFMMLSMRVAQPLVNLAKLFEDYEEVGAAIGEAASVLNRPLEGGSSARGLRPRVVGGIIFDKVSFAYPGVKVPALDRVSFEIKPGQLVGIVGRSGSGKSTIVRLLQGITRDFVGALRIDGNDLREFNLSYLRQSFGVVLQDNFLFRGTIRDNIIASRPGLTTEDAVRAARLAGADEFIERMPQGYETIIEEGSPNLSGGQRQRLAIARALITNPPILILDEPTSALDPESEALVNENILSIGRDRTTVIVSHRLSSLTQCDQILVLDQGAVMDIADHATLLTRCALYRQLWQQQTGGEHAPVKGGDHVVFPRSAAS